MFLSSAKLYVFLAIVVVLVAAGSVVCPDQGINVIDSFIALCGHVISVCVVLCEFLFAVFHLILSIIMTTTTLTTANNQNYSGKVFVITGASSGLGADVAVLAAERGARLLLAARRFDRLEEVKRKCLQAGAKQVEILVMDTSSPQLAHTQLIETISDKFLGKLHALILNAGIPGPWSRFENVSEMVMLEKIMEVNFWGYVRTTRLALPLLKESKGHIVVVSSMYGHIAAPFQAAYSASKHALTGFYDSLREELRGEVGVSIHSPGGVATEVQSRFQNSAGHDAVLTMPSIFLASSFACARSILHAYDTQSPQSFYPPLATALVQSKLAFGEWFDWMYFRLVEEYTKAGVMTLTSDKK